MTACGGKCGEKDGGSIATGGRRRGVLVDVEAFEWERAQKGSRGYETNVRKSTRSVACVAHSEKERTNRVLVSLSLLIHIHTHARAHTCTHTQTRERKGNRKGAFKDVFECGVVDGTTIRLARSGLVSKHAGPMHPAWKARRVLLSFHGTKASPEDGFL